MSKTRPKLWRFTADQPRFVLGIAWWTLAAVGVMLAIRANNPASVVLCLIPVPVLALLAAAETHRALHEEAR